MVVAVADKPADGLGTHPEGQLGAVVAAAWVDDRRGQLVISGGHSVMVSVVVDVGEVNMAGSWKAVMPRALASEQGSVTVLVARSGSAEIVALDTA